MQKNDWREILEEMCDIFRINFCGNSLSCELVPYESEVYLAVLAVALKEVKSTEDNDRIRYYRKIERSFIDDIAGTNEMNKTIKRLLFQTNK